jgi:hypothetical protein
MAFIESSVAHELTNIYVHAFARHHALGDMDPAVVELATESRSLGSEIVLSTH